MRRHEGWLPVQHRWYKGPGKLIGHLATGSAASKFGVTPDKVVDVQALAGDSTDNVPGAPGGWPNT